jgi:hypothetical protein
MLLSFDLSTTVCGYSLFDLKTKELVDKNFYCFKGETLLAKADELKLLIDKIEFAVEHSYNNSITHFVIEERLKAFQSGKSSAEAILKLGAFNFLCQYLAKEKSWKVSEVSVNTARKTVFPGFHSLAKKQKAKQKEFAVELFLKMFPEITFPTKIMKSGARKGQEVLIDEAADMIDSLILGEAFLKLQ